MYSRIFLLAVFLALVAGLSLSGASVPTAAAAVGTTYNVTSTSCTGSGSITDAMDMANKNPGTDTISIASGLQINAAGCPPPPDFSGPPDEYFILKATDSVIIEGNGAQLVGQIQWITKGGLDTPIGPSAICHDQSIGDTITALTPGFIKVGIAGQDNSAVTVTVRDLDMQELNSVALIHENATLILEDLTLNRIIAGFTNCKHITVLAEAGANFTARRTNWDTIWNAHQVIAGNVPYPFFAPIGAITGKPAGDLNIEDSDFKDIWSAGTIWWWGQAGSQANIVTSRFEAQGIFADGQTETNIVNSIWSDEVAGTPRIEDHIVNASSGDMNIIASTILYPSVECDVTCSTIGAGWIYREPGGGKINFVQSAVGVNFPNTTPATLLLDPGGSAGFSADIYSWIQPTSLQNAAALKTVTNQPNLLTDPPGLRTEGLFTLAEWATPLDPGELIDVIPDANCGNTNELLNPIDGSCITVDALGNPRVDANDKRNIGAVQLTLAPFLTVTGAGDQTVDLSWTKPQFSAPATGITGYELRYRETGTGSWTTVPVPGPDNLTANVGGLTNGTDYEFEVRATYSPSGEGPWSNNVTATPLGPIGAPVVTATPGNGQVDLSWTKPDEGGHVLSVYTIRWRRTGTATWIGATSVPATDTQITITSLTNGTEYEFAVTANSTDGTQGSPGTDTATPTQPTAVTLEAVSTKTAPTIWLPVFLSLLVFIVLATVFRWKAG